MPGSGGQPRTRPPSGRTFNAPRLDAANLQDDQLDGSKLQGAVPASETQWCATPNAVEGLDPQAVSEANSGTAPG
jgi:hypothetical protein